MILKLQILNFISAILKFTHSALCDHPLLFAISFRSVWLHFSNLNVFVSSPGCVISPLTLYFQISVKTSQETCVPTMELGNPASCICQSAEGRWMVREESVASFLYWGKGPSNWQGPTVCSPAAVAVTPQPPFQVTNSKESFARQSRLLCIAQDQANNICFSMSNSKLIYLK